MITFHQYGVSEGQKMALENKMLKNAVLATDHVWSPCQSQTAMCLQTIWNVQTHSTKNMSLGKFPCDTCDAI